MEGEKEVATTFNSWLRTMLEDSLSSASTVGNFKKVILLMAPAVLGDEFKSKCATTALQDIITPSQEAFLLATYCVKYAEWIEAFQKAKGLTQLSIIPNGNDNTPACVNQKVGWTPHGKLVFNRIHALVKLDRSLKTAPMDQRRKFELEINKEFADAHDLAAANTGGNGIVAVNDL